MILTVTVVESSVSNIVKTMAFNQLVYSIITWYVSE